MFTFKCKSTGRSRTFGSDDAALACFAIYLIAAYVAIVFHFGKDEWFIRGDWAFILPEMLPNVFQPVEQHWSTVPILIHRTYIALFGVSYFPFLATVSGLHIAIVCLVRATLRRAGVSPWMASAVAAPLALFGPGYMAIVFSLQISQDLSLAFGLAHLLLADHDGKLRPRDWVGLWAGTIGLMSSGLAVFLVVAVGIVALGRRGFRAAAFHTVPLGTLYLVWFFATRPAALGGRDVFRAGGYDASGHVLFVWRGIAGTMSALGHFMPVTLAFVAIGVIGLFAIPSPKAETPPSRRLLPLALVAVTPLYLGVIGYQRSSSGAEYATYSHHLYTIACFVLPALGVSADAIARTVPKLAPALACLFLVPVPFNLRGFDQQANQNVFLAKGFLQSNRRRLLAVAHSPYAAQALDINRANLATDRWYSSITVGWALDQAKLGRISDPGPVNPDLDDSIQLQYGVTFVRTQTPGPTCQPHQRPVEIRPRRGELVETGTPITVSNARRGEPGVSPLVFGSASAPTEGQVLRIEIPDMVLRLAPVDGLGTYSYCSASQPPEVVEAVANDADEQAESARQKAVAETLANDPKAAEAFRKAIAEDPKAMAAMRKALQRARQTNR